MSPVTTVCIAILAVTAWLCLARVVRRGGSLADRIIGLDSMLIVIVAGVAVLIARTDDGAFLDVIVVGTLLGFLTTVTVGRFIERRGA